MSIFVSNSNDSTTSGINFIGFNQDSGCFAVGLKNGFRVYNTDPLKENEKMDFINQMESGVGYVEMLFRTNFLGILGGGPNPMFPANQCRIWDDIKRKFVIEFEYPSDIKCIKLRYDRMVVVLELCVKVYSFEALPHLLFQVDTGANAMGLCAVCHSNIGCASSGPGPGNGLASSGSLMALPDKKMGRTAVYDMSRFNNETASPITTFTAHQNPLTALAFNSSGTILATASSKGTLIRLFNPLTGVRLHELRRGTNNAIIYSICFNQDSSLMSVTSDHDTVHVFRLETGSQGQSLGGSVSNPTGVTGQVSDKLGSGGSGNSDQFLGSRTGRNTSDIRCVLNSKAKAVAGFSLISPNTLIVLDSNGTYLKYSFSEKIGCTAKREQCVNFLNYDDDGDHF